MQVPEKCKRGSPAKRHDEVKMLGVKERKKLAAAILADGLIRLLSKEENSQDKGSPPNQERERRASNQNHNMNGAAGEIGRGK